MKNPNAFAAFIAGEITIGVQWLLTHYGHWTLPTEWKAAVTAAIISLVLLIGKDGVKGAIVRGLTFLKKLWTGFGSPPPVSITIDPNKADEMAKAALIEAQAVNTTTPTP